MDVSRDDGERLLGPYCDRVRRVIYQAETELNEGAGAILHRFRPGTRMGMLNDLVFTGLVREFIGSSDVQFRRSRGLRILCIRDQGMLRVKKVDRNLRTRDNLNRQTDNYLEQRPLLPPEEMPPTAPHFIIGYQVSKVGSIVSAHIIYPNGTSVAWEIPLDARDSGADNITAAPLPEPQPKPLTGRVRAKADLQQEGDKENGRGHQPASG